MDHIKILKRALHITWRYRALWLVGLLLVLAGGGVIQATGGTSGSPGGGGGDAPEMSGGSEDWGQTPEEWQEFRDTMVPILILVGILILTLMVVFGLIGIVRVVLRFLTRVSLIDMTNRYEETGEEVGFWDGLRLGWSASALQLFLINLLLKLPPTLVIMLGVASLLLLAVFSFIAGGPAIALGVVSLLLLFPVILFSVVLGVIVGPIIQIAHREAVIEKKGAWQAIVGALGLIRRHFGAVALQWLLLVGLRIAWGVAMVPVNLVLALLGLLIGGLPALLLGGLIGLAAGWVVGLIIGILLFIPIMFLIVGLPNLALNTAATVYHSVVWTLTYRELVALDTDTQIYRADLDDDDGLLDLEELPEA